MYICVDLNVNVFVWLKFGCGYGLLQGLLVSIWIAVFYCARTSSFMMFCDKKYIYMVYHSCHCLFVVNLQSFQFQY